MPDSCGITIPDPGPQPVAPEPLGRGGWLALDLRSLALMRVSVAVMLLVDLALRAREVGMFYTDTGVLPRADMLAEWTGSAKYFAYSWFGTAGPQYAIMAVHALVTLLLLVGYRTRIVTILSWFLLTSLHMRNPLVCHGGDHMVRLALFWAIFLPIGARWSIDSALNTVPRRRNDAYFDFPVIAFLVQLSLVYVAAAVHKILAPAWQAGDGVYYALHVDQHVTAAGIWMQQFDFVLPLLTWLTILVELLGPLLLFLPRFTSGARLLTMLGFIGLHVMFGVCFYLTVFPFMAVAIWLGVLPGPVWDRVFSWLRTEKRTGLRIYYDGDCGFCQRTAWILRTFLLLPETPVVKAQSDATIEQVFRANDSWVVIDHAGKQHLHFDGIVTVLRHSPIAWPLAPLAGLPPCRAIGNACYRLLAKNRNLASKLTFFLRPRPMNVKPSLIRSGLAFALIGFVCLLNIRTLHDMTKRLVPRPLEAAGRAVHIAQKWDMFVNGTEHDGWYVLRAVKADGTELDLITGAPVTYEKPLGISSMYPTHRWAVCVILSRETDRRGGNFVRYICDDWNRSHDGGDRLVEVELVHMYEFTEPGFEHPAQRQSIAILRCVDG